MAENLTKSQIDEIQSAFETFDKDHDGLITIEARLKLNLEFDCQIAGLTNFSKLTEREHRPGI